MRRILLVAFVFLAAFLYADPTAADWVKGGWFVPEDPDVALMISETFDGYGVAVQYHEWSCNEVHGRLEGSAISAMLTTEGMKAQKNVVMAIVAKKEEAGRKLMTMRLDGKDVTFVQSK